MPVIFHLGCLGLLCWSGWAMSLPLLKCNNWQYMSVSKPQPSVQKKYLLFGPTSLLVHTTCILMWKCQFGPIHPQQKNSTVPANEAGIFTKTHLPRRVSQKTVYLAQPAAHGGQARRKKTSDARGPGVVSNHPLTPWRTCMIRQRTGGPVLK